MQRDLSVKTFRSPLSIELSRHCMLGQLFALVPEQSMKKIKSNNSYPRLENEPASVALQLHAWTTLVINV